MADPTIQKNWEFQINNVVLADATVGGFAFRDRRNLLFNIKEALVNNGSTTFSTPWTHVASCDSTTTSTVSDLWTDFSDLVWRDDDTANVFSWIVLRQTGISATFELLITCEQDSNINDGSRIGAWVAQGGFTGGTTTTRPTAPDERELRNSTSSGHWGSGADGASYTFRWHLCMSSDGQCTRIFFFVNKIVTGFWIFDVPDNPVVGWANPYMAGIYGENNVTTNVVSYERWNENATMKGQFGGIDTTMFLSSEGITNGSIGEFLFANQIDNTWVASEMGVASQTATFTGVMGSAFDMWWGAGFAGSEGTGRLYPENGTKLYVQIKDMIFPWDGASILGTR